MSTNVRYIDKYELKERLGRGGMAEVWKAYDAQLQRYVALKILHADLQADPEFLARFVREARVIARCGFDRMAAEAFVAESHKMKAKAAHFGLKVAEVPVRYQRRRYGKSKISGTVWGSIRAGVKILWTIFCCWRQDFEPRRSAHPAGS